MIATNCGNEIEFEARDPAEEQSVALVGKLFEILDGSAILHIFFNYLIQPEDGREGAAR
ncbi:MAG: hypothetical protein WCA95_03600 [Opitutaceae bacterium]